MIILYYNIGRYFLFNCIKKKFLIAKCKYNSNKNTTMIILNMLVHSRNVYGS